ncbi:Pantothenate kinase type III, CoaX-like protein [Lunatimonas lonarensis]|uniref:Type III pantothenate kinase n=1 Tax=Lunatimonas lonarensis TaxID=1232681 RepID=R7ZZ09_9BACT|nr:type III pantothenate kinase [Lunatimonas lonarensis]EON79294.1 Pantothenate kinase type III, CoaX-like protein [Lunatimonas lonarensis]
MDYFIVDIGNSRIKGAHFRDNALREEWSMTAISELNRLADTLVFERALVSSVKWRKDELEASLGFPFVYFDYETGLPVKNCYETPFTLGLDRIAAVIGARCFKPEGPLLAIDLGTCITYEFLDSDNSYLGGGISPGIQLRAEAMHRHTARLPLVEWPKDGVPLIGRNTRSCMQSGMYYGVRHEVFGMIQSYSAAYPGLGVYICGGDAKYFESLTKEHIFVIPNLVLYGLNRILSYNVEKLRA